MHGDISLASRWRKGEVEHVESLAHIEEGFTAFRPDVFLASFPAHFLSPHSFFQSVGRTVLG